MNYKKQIIIIICLVLFNTINIQAQGFVGSGFTYHPIAKTKGANIRFGMTQDKIAFYLEYNHFFPGEGKKLYQVGANFNFKWKLAVQVNAKIIGGGFLMRYKSTKFTSSSLPFSVASSSDNLVGGNIGLGVDVLLSKHFMIFVEGKYTIHKKVEKNFLFEEASGQYFIPNIGVAFLF